MTEEDARQAEAALRWWRALQDLTPKGEANPRADRAARARLRRANVTEAMRDEATLDLCRKLYPETRDQWMRLSRAAIVACVLAQVREDVNGARFARQIGPTSMDEEDSAPVKRLRFHRLLVTEDDEETVRAFRRTLATIGNKANVGDLAHVLLTWRRDTARTRFAFDYFNTLFDASASQVP